MVLDVQLRGFKLHNWEKRLCLSNNEGDVLTCLDYRCTHQRKWLMSSAETDATSYPENRSSNFQGISHSFWWCSFDSDVSDASWKSSTPSWMFHLDTLLKDGSNSQGLHDSIVPARFGSVIGDNIQGELINWQWLSVSVFDFYAFFL